MAPMGEKPQHLTAMTRPPVKSSNRVSGTPASLDMTMRTPSSSVRRSKANRSPYSLLRSASSSSGEPVLGPVIVWLT